LFEYLTVKYNFGTQYGFRNRKCLLREVPLWKLNPIVKALLVLTSGMRHFC
jgi:hypothetical protein